LSRKTLSERGFGKREQGVWQFCRTLQFAAVGLAQGAENGKPPAPAAGTRFDEVLRDKALKPTPLIIVWPGPENDLPAGQSRPPENRWDCQFPSATVTKTNTGPSDQALTSTLPKPRRQGNCRTTRIPKVRKEEIAVLSNKR